jgi:polar amino acid transport system permease protein|tara:strand:- start:1596 stop:2273 length:678 start_codon:yes stop_codon:yes gene_type:complete
VNLRFFEIYRSYEYLELLAIGIFNSVIITTCAGIIGFSLGVLFAVLRYEKITVLGLICASYTDFVRNTPLIVQMFFVTFGLPQLLGYEWPFWAHAILALTLNFSAYFSEIVWAGLKTVNKGQIEAAKSMGLPRWKILWTILLPQAIAKMFPSLNAQFVFLFLTTGIMSEISVMDLTYAGVFIDSRTFRSFEVFLTLTILYILIALVFKFLITLIERRVMRWKFAS